MKHILDQKLTAYRSRVNDIVKNLHQMAHEINNEALFETISELRSYLNEPFMFVVVGEVKAGKSSFVNALLEANKDICQVAPDPCTEVVQEIVYGEQESEIFINDNLKKVTLPVDILKDIAIVDTPGTSSIVQKHQEITERFVPASDLIVFVFPARNPFHRETWEFFDYIYTDWHKKIIFVLQQKDLIDNKGLETNKNWVVQHVQKKGVENPQVFAVSAKLELEGNSESGFSTIRDYIQANITGGQASTLKLRNNIRMAQNLTTKIQAGVAVRTEQLNADLHFLQEIRDILENQEKLALQQVTLLVENVLTSYHQVGQQMELVLLEDLKTFNLAKKAASSIFRKQPPLSEQLKTFSDNLQTQLSKVLKDKLNEGVYSVAYNIQQMAELIEQKIKHTPTILQNNHELFGDVAKHRETVLRDLEGRFRQFSESVNTIVNVDLSDNPVNFSSDIFVGAGAALGGALMTITTSLVLDMTGVFVGLGGLVYAGMSINRNRGKLLYNYHQQILKGSQELRQSVREKLENYIRTVKNKINENFKEFDAMVALEVQQVDKLKGKLNHISNDLSEMMTEMDADVNSLENKDS